MKIVVSGSLDEHGLARLVADGAPVDAAGVGTLMGVSADAPYLDSAYKLVSYGGRPVAKLSTGKATYPGAKQVFRRPGSRDVLGLRDEASPAGSTPLLELVMEKGRRRRPADPLDAQRERCRRDLSPLPPTARALVDPVAPTVEVSAALAELNDRVRADLEARELGRGPSL